MGTKCKRNSRFYYYFKLKNGVTYLFTSRACTYYEKQLCHTLVCKITDSGHSKRGRRAAYSISLGEIMTL